MGARKVLVGFAVGLLAIVFARYLQVELADRHSSPWTAQNEFDFRQLIDGPPDGD